MRSEKEIRDAIEALEGDRQALLDLPDDALHARRMISVTSRIDELKWTLGDKE
ncbi:hypothetical protein [Cryobacterium melibiosiphilum]|uniref:hypothetical protein n=1 Tax=Cryobacterium melibiosiphilum TaxID=995039 RepID=UPI0013149319|nr:hypothetical protein [Cryobacterium melibiosiphilum]